MAACSLYLITNEYLLAAIFHDLPGLFYFYEGNFIMDSQDLQTPAPESGAEPPVPKLSVSRRTAMKLGALGLTASTLGLLGAEGWLPRRMAFAAPPQLPNIQFDISNYIAPVETIDGTLFRFGPVYTLFLTARLHRTPTHAEQHALAEALDTLESTYPFSPSGLFTFLSYGLPYFKRLPAELVSSSMPRLLSDHTRFALEEAIPGPTDVSPGNPK
jgi:hypothetical protein